VEKAPTVGGTTWKSGGIYWIPNNAFMPAERVTDDKADCPRYMARISFPTICNPAHAKLGLAADEYALLETIYDRGENAVAALGTMGALKVNIRRQRDKLYPDYYPTLEENKASVGRGLMPDPPDGKPVDGSEELIRQLKAAAERRKIPILLKHRVARLVGNGRGEIIGIEGGNSQEMGQ
jgi:3-oxosteroid 1-dehydrogenase